MFTWVQNITADTKIGKAAIDEIRTNADWLNNPANIVYCTAHYGEHFHSDYTTHMSGHYSSNQASDYVPHYSGNYAYYSAHYGYCTAHYTANYSKGDSPGMRYISKNRTENKTGVFKWHSLGQNQ